MVTAKLCLKARHLKPPVSPWSRDWEQGWRSGESARLTPLWPGFDSGPVPDEKPWERGWPGTCHMWVEFVVGSLRFLFDQDRESAWKWTRLMCFPLKNCNFVYLSFCQILWSYIQRIKIRLIKCHSSRLIMNWHYSLRLARTYARIHRWTVSVAKSEQFSESETELTNTKRHTKIESE